MFTVSDSSNQPFAIAVGALPRPGLQGHRPGAEGVSIHHQRISWGLSHIREKAGKKQSLQRWDNAFCHADVLP